MIFILLLSIDNLIFIVVFHIFTAAVQIFTVADQIVAADVQIFYGNRSNIYRSSSSIYSSRSNIYRNNSNIYSNYPEIYDSYLNNYDSYKMFIVAAQTSLRIHSIRLFLFPKFSPHYTETPVFSLGNLPSSIRKHHNRTSYGLTVK